MAIPESIGVAYTSGVPLELVNEDGLDLAAGPAASVPVPVPGNPGDIITVFVEGTTAVRFRCGGPGDYATTASNPVPAGEKEVFLLAASGMTHISVVTRSGSAWVTVNCYRRGT